MGQGRCTSTESAVPPADRVIANYVSAFSPTVPFPRSRNSSRMTLTLLSRTPRLLWPRRLPYQQSFGTRFLSSNASIHSSAPYVGPKPTFESAGIRAPIASALRAAFPNVQHPTQTQGQFIPAVLSGKDVLLKDGTGTGKYVFFCFSSVH